MPHEHREAFLPSKGAACNSRLTVKWPPSKVISGPGTFHQTLAYPGATCHCRANLAHVRQGQIMALAFSQKSLTRSKLLPLRSEAVHTFATNLIGPSIPSEPPRPSSSSLLLSA